MTVDETSTSDHSRTVLRVDDDDLDAANEHALHARLASALDAGPRVLVLDLERCRYLDAPALRVLADAAHRASAQGTRLQVLHGSADALRLLELAGLAGLALAAAPADRLLAPA